MPVNATRLEHDLMTIAQATDTPGQGASRPTFSDAWRAARDYVIRQAQQHGCQVRIDSSANVHIRSESVPWDRKVWMSGSHVDSVPCGGDYDGVLGVVGPLEVLRAAHEDGRQDLPLELVIFAEEEGTTFGLGMIGSRSWAGTLHVENLAQLKSSSGQTYLELGGVHGLAPERISSDLLSADDYLGMIELHIEQGPAMWKRNEPVAIVTAINGRRQYRVELAGMANHAGSTGMADRRDALAGAAEIITSLEGLAKSLSPRAVATVGYIQCWPNAVNVIPEKVIFTIDFRAPADDLIERGEAQIRAAVETIAAHRALYWRLDETESLAAVGLDAGVCQRLREAAQRLGHSNPPETNSGALHDAAIIAPYVPTAMLFVASRDGISHNPAEFSRLEDIELATNILYEAVK